MDLIKKNSSLQTGLTGSQAHTFHEYLQATLAEIEGRNYSKANRHEADRVRELIEKFQRIQGAADDAEREWTSREVANLLAYIERRQAEFEASKNEIRSREEYRSYHEEDMAQLVDQWRTYQRAKEKLTELCAEAR